MEPFGLFDFLQALLPNSTTKNPDGEAATPAELAPSSAPVDSQVVPESDNKKAAIGFLEAHERRAKHFRK